MQGRFGDLKLPKPSWTQPIEQFKWEGWNDLRGMDQYQSMEEFMLMCRFLGFLREIDYDPLCIEVELCLPDGSLNPVWGRPDLPQRLSND